MTRYQLLRLIRRLLGRLPGYQNDYMPRTGQNRTDDPISD
jgi:hypothetical protein